MRTIRVVVLLSAVVLQLGAQANRASLRGTVTDASGAALAGAAVTLRNVETNQSREVKSGTEGEYTIPSLAPGSYELAVAAQGFRMASLKFEF